MITSIDFKILDAIQFITNPVLDAFFVVITHLGDAGALWIAIAVLCLCFKKTRKCGVMLAVVLILGTLLGNVMLTLDKVFHAQVVLKNIIARPRPFVQNPEMLKELLIAAPHGFSCPSGHTLASFESAFVIFLNNKKWGIVSLVIAALIAFSRMYLYVHFFTDILLGTMLGIVLGCLVYYAVNKIEGRIKNGKKI